MKAGPHGLPQCDICGGESHAMDTILGLSVCGSCQKEVKQFLLEMQSRKSGGRQSGGSRPTTR